MGEKSKKGLWEDLPKETLEKLLEVLEKEEPEKDQPMSPVKNREHYEY